MQMSIASVNGVAYLFSFVDGFVPVKKPAGKHIPEEKVLEIAEKIAETSPEEAYAYLNRWLRNVCVT